MPLDWTEWRNKLIAIDYPNAASLDEQTVMQLLFRPSAKRKKFVTWVSRKIVESTCYETDLLSIYSSFVFGGKETITSFIEGTHRKHVMENIWNSILNDLRPMTPMCGDRESWKAVLSSSIATMSAEQLEYFGITSLPPGDSSRQPDILDGVDGIINRAEAVLAKHTASVATPPSVVRPRSPEKPIKQLAKLIEDAEKLNLQSKCDNSVQAKRIEPAMTQIAGAAADLDECMEGLRNMKAALKKMDSHGLIIGKPSVDIQDD